MILERYQPIEMDDGNVLRADIYRPDTDQPVPVIMTCGPYGKGVRYRTPTTKTPGTGSPANTPTCSRAPPGATLRWEPVDPEIWIPWGYAVIRIDSRGAGRSPGYLDLMSLRETRDYYNAIEWAGQLPWSNGKVGLNGISYYAINQWQVASLQPPHLAAMIPWEGAADMYRDWSRHGGILSNVFASFWFPMQVQSEQHGNTAAPMDP